MRCYYKPEVLLGLSKVSILYQASQAESPTWILFYTLSYLIVPEVDLLKLNIYIFTEEE